MRRIVEILLIVVIVLILAWGAVLILSKKPPREESAFPVALGELSAPVPSPTSPTLSLQEPVSPLEKALTGDKSPVLFSGKVLDEQGNPASGVHVRLYRYTDLFFIFDLLDERLYVENPRHETVSDDRGEFLFQGFPQGLFRLEVKSGKYVNYWMDTGFGIKQGVPLTELELGVVKGEALEGIVRDPGGSPVPDALVLFTAKGENRIFYDRAMTGRDGRFVFPHIPTGKDLFIMASKKGFAPGSYYPVSVPSSSSKPLDLELGKSISLKGRIFSHDGAPAKGAEILSKITVKAGEEKRILGFAPVKADEQGMFELNDLPPGDLRLLVRGNAGERIHEKNLKIESNSVSPELKIQLEKGSSISGVVVDDRGTTLTDVLVYYPGSDAFASALTGKDGTFNLPRIGKGRRNIFALAHDKAVVKEQDVEPGTRNIRMVLHSGASVTGIVRAQSTNQPLKDARISILTGDLSGPDRIANSLGQYQAHYLPEAQAASLMAAAAGFSSRKSQELDLKPGGDYVVDFLLKSGGSISGHVWEEGTGKPIHGASVHDFFPNYFEPVFTDDNGFFRVEHLPAGSESLNVNREGYISPRARRFLIKEGEEITGADFFMVKEARISGRVINQKEEPIFGVKVSGSWGLFQRIQDNAQNQTQTDHEGRYTLPGLISSEPVTLSALHEDYAPAKMGPFQLKSGEERTNVDIIMTQGGSIKGRVMNEKGISLSGSEIAHTSDTIDFIGANIGIAMGMIMRGQFIPANDDGEYEIKRLAPGNYTVLARSEGFVSEFRQNVVVREGETTDKVDFKLKTAAALAGRVKNDKGEMIDKAEVMAMAIDFQSPVVGFDRTDENGRFRIEGLAPRSYMVFVERKPYPQLQNMNVTAPNENLELILESGGAIRGRVLDNKTKKPVENYKIFAEFTTMGPFGMGAMGGQQQLNRSTDINDPEGMFELTGLKEGKYSLKVRAGGYAEEVKKGVQVKNGETVDGIEIGLKAGSKVEGRVITGSDKAPIPGVLVKPSDEGSKIMGVDISQFDFQPLEGNVITDDDGRFRLQNLSSGLNTLEAKKEGFLDGKKMVFVLPGQDMKDVEIELSRGGIVTGRVVAHSSGKPVSGADVTFSGQGFLADLMPFVRKGTLTEDQGGFEFHTVPAGAQTMKISHDDYAMKMVENVNVEEGKTVDIGDVALTSGGGIAGVVLDASSKPISGAMLMARGSSGFHQQNTNAEGEYAYEELSPGSYTVQLIPSTDGLMSGNIGNVVEKQAQVEEGKVTELNFILTPGYALSGKVTRRGETVPGVNVMFQLDDPLAPANESGSYTVDSQGRYEFRELQPGRYILTVLSGSMQAGRDVRPLFIGRTDVREDTIYDIALPLASVSGQVRDAETNQPLSGAMISIIRTTDPKTAEDMVRSGRFGEIMVLSNENGLYKIEDLEEGDMYVFARHEVYAYEMQPLTLGSGEEKTGLDFPLSPGLYLKGRAIMKETSQPPSRLHLLLLNQDGMAIYNLPATLDGDGSFTIKGLREGSYNLSAYPEGGAPVINLPCSVKPEDDQLLTLEFDKGGILVLDVFDPDKKPIAKVKVELIDSNGRLLDIPLNLDSLLDYNNLTFTDTNGHYERKHIPAGPYTLKVSASKFETVSSGILIPDGGTVAQNMTLTGSNN
jgi:protocatechuate 3,4-dioxygenase beta subunit